MQNFRNLLIIVAILAATLGGLFLLNLINSNNAIDSSSASVYNTIGLNQTQDNILYPDKIIINVSAQIITQNINSGTLNISYDKNVLSVEEIVMPPNIIALNQKIDTTNGLITLEFTSTNSQSLENVVDVTKIVFNKLQNTNELTGVTLLGTSTLGSPNTLDGVDKLLNVSF